MLYLDIYSVDKDGEEYYDFIHTSIDNAFFGGLKKGAKIGSTSVFPERKVILIKKRK